MDVLTMPMWSYYEVHDAHFTPESWITYRTPWVRNINLIHLNSVKAVKDPYSSYPLNRARVKNPSSGTCVVQKRNTLPLAVFEVMQKKVPAYLLEGFGIIILQNMPCKESRTILRWFNLKTYQTSKQWLVLSPPLFPVKLIRIRNDLPIWDFCCAWSLAGFCIHWAQRGFGWNLLSWTII